MYDLAVDIQMPVRCGGHVEGRVLMALLGQDIPVRLFVDASKDLELTGPVGDLIELIGFDDEESARVKLRLRAGVKRNRLMFQGRAAYVYLADPDVLPPSEPRLFRRLAQRLADEPSLGAIGLAYFRNDESHVGAGSMMLRRTDYEALGRVRGAGVYCNCDYIKREFERQGLAVRIFPDEAAQHLRDEPQPADGLARIVADPTPAGEIPESEIRKMMDAYGPRFLLLPSIAAPVAR